MFSFLTSCCQKLPECLMEKERLLVRCCFWSSCLWYRDSESIKDSLLKKKNSLRSLALFFLRFFFPIVFNPQVGNRTTQSHPPQVSRGDGWFIIPAYVLLLCMINLMESKWWAPYAAAVLSRVGKLIYHCTMSQGGHLLLIQTTDRDVNS